MTQADMGDIQDDAGAGSERPEPSEQAEQPQQPRSPVRSDKAVRRRRRTRRVLIGALTLLLAGTGAISGTGWWAVEHYTGKVSRIPNAFPTGVPAGAEPKASKGGETFLLVGVDRRSDLPTTGRNAKVSDWKYGAQRSDTMMLVHIPADHDNAYVVSLPRDSWVAIPGHGKAKLNAAFSWGGSPLLIDTVQRLTDVRIDHLAVIDWSGFKALTDSVGGVTLGGEHLDGEQALSYVRERYHLPRGDFDRTHRQQAYLRAVISKTLTGSTFSSPLKAKQLLDQVSETVSVDDQLSDDDLRDLLWSMKGVRLGDMVFMNAPVTGTDMIKGQSVVLLDANSTSQLWEAMSDDTMADYIATHSVDKLGATTR